MSGVLRRCGLLAVLLWLAVQGTAWAMSVRVVDAASRRPIEGARVTIAARVEVTDAAGIANLPGATGTVAVRAAGYRRTERPAADTQAQAGTIEVALDAFLPKALYLSFYGIGDAGLRGAALKLIEDTELNALVIDVKGDRGGIPYRSGVATAAQVGAQQIITVRDLPGLVGRLHAQGIYLVARVVAFKDDPLARSRPELAVHAREGSLFVDREGLAWTDPFRREVREYVLEVAEEVARMGFDEIQFDYVRFPDETGLVFSEPNTEANRVAAIAGFLSEAGRRLAPYNVFIAADVFGYTLWNLDDTDIGQRLEDLMKHVDYLSPMLYPSSFQFGIPRYANPVAHPYEIVRLSLDNARHRTGLPPARFRPWLQAFRDYAFDRREFGADEIAAQIRAAESFGAGGWMLWNPRNVYDGAGIPKGDK